LLKEGLIVGVIGYASVALLYAAFDFLAARGALFTVDLLGKVVFKGLHDPSVLILPIEPDISAIFWYNVLHLASALIIGLIVVRIVKLTENQVTNKYLILFFLIIGFIATITFISFLTIEIRSLLPLWSIIMANLLAVILAGSYLLGKHPQIIHRINPFK